MILKALLGPLGSLASTWLEGKVETKAAETKMRVSESEAKSKMLLTAASSEADWERVMAQGSQNSLKDEYLVLLFSIPLVLAFCGDKGREITSNGFEALSVMPEWYQMTLGVIVASSFGFRAATKFFKK
jgi:hypothetical protein